MCFSVVYIEPFHERRMRVNSQVERIFNTGQRVSANGKQLRALARRDFGKIIDAAVPEYSGDDSTSELKNYSRRALKRQHYLSQITELPKRLVNSRIEDISDHFINVGEERNSGYNTPVSNGGNLYGGNGRTKATEYEMLGKASYLAGLASNDGDTGSSSVASITSGKRMKMAQWFVELPRTEASMLCVK